MTEIAPVRTVARDGRCPTVPKMFFRSSLTHRKILTILLSLVWLPATTQALDIAEGWRFTKGDDPAWAQPELARAKARKCEDVRMDRGIYQNTS